jgi:phospholipid N-methyltransferase
MSSVLPPGTILQLMYLRERLSLLQPGRFVEIGPGQGRITELLLQHGWRGQLFEFSTPAVENLRQRFAAEIAEGRLDIQATTFLKAPGTASADLVISCMVMEHLDDAEQARFWAVAAEHLRPGGLMIGIVPASPAHWGIEDDVAGHRRRYTRGLLQELAAGSQWDLTHVAGLTYPVSNVLLPVSNALVRRQERGKLKISTLERTKLSGVRDVSFKTSFPPFLKVLLNDVLMRPLHWLQKLLSGSHRAMVLYFEARPVTGRPPAP